MERKEFEQFGNSEDSFFKVDENSWGVLVSVEKFLFWKEILAKLFPLKFTRKFVVENWVTKEKETVTVMSKQWTKKNIGGRILYK